MLCCKSCIFYEYVPIYYSHPPPPSNSANSYYLDKYAFESLCIILYCIFVVVIISSHRSVFGSRGRPHAIRSEEKCKYLIQRKKNEQPNLHCCILLL